DHVLGLLGGGGTCGHHGEFAGTVLSWHRSPRIGPEQSTDTALNPSLLRSVNRPGPAHRRRRTDHRWPSATPAAPAPHQPAPARASTAAAAAVGYAVPPPRHPPVRPPVTRPLPALRDRPGQPARSPAPVAMRPQSPAAPRSEEHT